MEFHFFKNGIEVNESEVPENEIRRIKRAIIESKVERQLKEDGIKKYSGNK